MKVIVLNDCAWVNGGASKVALSSAAGLAAIGHEVRVVAGMGEPDDSIGVPIESLHMVPFNKLPARDGVRQSWWNQKAADAVNDALRGSSPRDTVIHIHSLRDVLSGSVVRTAQRLGFKTIYTHHDYGAACPYGGFFNYRTGAPCGRVALSPACIATACNLTGFSRKLGTVQKGMRERRLGFPASLNAHVFVSEFSRKIMARYIPEGALTATVRNPVAASNQLPLDPPGSAYVFVGRLTLEKDPVTFARAARSAQAEAVFVGDGPLRDAVALEGGRMLGWLDADRTIEVIRNAWALVFPSAWYETQGLSVAEAMACGVPVIASDACAAREPVEASGGGLLFSSGSAESLAAKIAELSDPELRADLSRRAHEWFWADPPTLDAHVEAISQLYQEVLSR